MRGISAYRHNADSHAYLSYPGPNSHHVGLITDRLSSYTVTAQTAINHVSDQVGKDINRLQPLYDAAVMQWDNHPLRIIPPTHAERQPWLKNLDAILHNVPRANDVSAWCLRAFASSAAMEAIQMEGSAFYDDKTAGLINQVAGREAYMAVTGDYLQNSAPVQRGPPSGVNLIGTKKHILNPQTGHSVEHTVIDYGHTVLGGYFYILEYQTPAGSRTRNLTQDEYEEMTPYHKRA